MYILPNDKIIIYNNNIYYSNNGIPTLIPLQSVVESLQSTVSNLQNNSYTNNNKPYVVGQYNGNDKTNTRVVSLGFTPICVIVMENGARILYAGVMSGGMAIIDYDAISPITKNHSVKIVTNGFTPLCFQDIESNTSGITYYYIAFK